MSEKMKVELPLNLTDHHLHASVCFLLKTISMKEPMSRRLENIKVDLDSSLEDVLEWLAPEAQSFIIRRESIDARGKKPHFVYTVDVSEKNDILSTVQLPPRLQYSGPPPLIIGSGPAGLFAALRLLDSGVPALLFEQGSMTEKRIPAIARFWRTGELHPRNNVGFGEGGAGLFSDGKLVTRIKSPHIPYVMNKFVSFGAPSHILYQANPHVGSDRIRRLIPRIREHLCQGGVQMFYDTKVTRLLTSGSTITGLQTESGQKFHSPYVLLATGHSADDMISHLLDLGVHIEGKDFAMGVRIEHPQDLISKIQYKEFASHPKLGAASYRLTHHDHTSGLGTYSFCMCPGGYVLSSGTASDQIVVNGMSNYKRNSPFANSGIVVTVHHQRHFGPDILGGLKLRNEIENRAFLTASKNSPRSVPAQSLLNFLSRKNGPTLPSSCPSGVVPARLDDLLPGWMLQSLMDGFKTFAKKMQGFLCDQAQLHGFESRTSSPVRILRNPNTLESTSHPGLFPMGEGAGYAGGITSAACDGVRIADKLVEKIKASGDRHVPST